MYCHRHMQATRHAEMEAIDKLLEQWQEKGHSKPEISENFSKCILYVTCEPCIMCASALSIIGMVLSFTVLMKVNFTGFQYVNDALNLFRYKRGFLWMS